jgi:nucleotide-binding universal stress UspA family protein
MVECLLMQSGRPVLVLPCHGSPPDQCRSALVAWDGSREAARALHDAMPLLRQAHRVTVLSVERVCTAARQPDTDVVAHLARHGISVTVARVTVEDLAVSEVLLNHAADMGADLLVAGGYGHSRLREAVFGGVTRDLLRHMTIPVLFSH